MGIFDTFRTVKEPEEIDDNIRNIGKIIKLSDEGWGFITSKEIPFTRIFFHWTSLIQETLKFTELEEGMQVEFKAIEIPEKGFRAIKIKVINE